MLDSVPGWVRAADPSSLKASQRGSQAGTAAELRCARDELAQAEAGRRRLRRELDPMVGRVAQLTAQLCEYSGRGNWESAVVTTTLLRAMMIRTVRAGVMSMVLRAVTLSVRIVFTATVIVTVKSTLTKSRTRARLTAPEGSEMTGIGMAAVVLRLGAEMAPAMTEMLVSPLKICSSE